MAYVSSASKRQMIKDEVLSAISGGASAVIYGLLLGGREAEIGLVIGSLSVSAILIRPWLGRVMDTKGRRPVVIAGGIVNVIAVSAYLSSPSNARFEGKSQYPIIGKGQTRP